MLQNQMPVLIEGQQTKTWTQVHATTLSGRKLCIVGLGSLGGGVARRARALGMYVIGVRHGRELHPDCDKTVSTDALDAALMQADDVLLACPLTETTRNILSRDRIALLRTGARVINIARGEVWDQEAVCDALDAGDLESAFTDVTVPEPLPTHHRLWNTRGIILTPHIAADDRERYNDVTLDILARNLRAARDGAAMPNRVDLVKGY
jgi:phosphoglycerate dehydrogenase-like enzyme